MLAIGVVIAIGGLVALVFLWAWHLDRVAKRHGHKSPDPATMTRTADDQRRNPEAVEHLFTVQSHTGM